MSRTKSRGFSWKAFASKIFAKSAKDVNTVFESLSMTSLIVWTVGCACGEAVSQVRFKSVPSNVVSKYSAFCHFYDTKGSCATVHSSKVVCKILSFAFSSVYVYMFGSNIPQFPQKSFSVTALLLLSLHNFRLQTLLWLAQGYMIVWFCTKFEMSMDLVENWKTRKKDWLFFFAAFAWKSAPDIIPLNHFLRLLMHLLPKFNLFHFLFATFGFKQHHWIHKEPQLQQYHFFSIDDFFAVVSLTWYCF